MFFGNCHFCIPVASELPAWLGYSPFLYWHGEEGEAPGGKFTKLGVQIFLLNFLSVMNMHIFLSQNQEFARYETPIMPIDLMDYSFAMFA